MIKVHLFAILREQAGHSLCETGLEPEMTPKMVYKKLQQEFGFTLEIADLKVAVNDEFVSWDYELQTNDEVVFIPPVAGG